MGKDRTGAGRSGRGRRAGEERDAVPAGDTAASPKRGRGEAPAGPCWLCGRPLGRLVEWHHPTPKSRGGRTVVPLHPICHRTIHASFTNAELARMAAEGIPLSDEARIRRFLAWIANKPPDFSAPTRSR